MAILLPLIVVLVIGASGLWVYSDAIERQERGRPVVAAIGSVHVETPAVWSVACVIAWILFFPLYLNARSGVQ